MRSWDDVPEHEPSARPVRPRLHAQPKLRVERVRGLVQELDRLAAAQRALDTDRARLAEGDVEAVVARERRLEHLLLHVAVDRDRQLAAVLAQPDQRVLLGELVERDTKASSCFRVDGLDDRLERRRCELLPHDRVCAAEPVADLDAVQPPDLRDLAGRGGGPAHRPAVIEHLELGHLGVADPVTHTSASRHGLAGRRPSRPWRRGRS